ncbi:MAG: RcpC/CpaB family pilus assembly protein, partial [Actinomycetes bacterium]
AVPKGTKADEALAAGALVAAERPRVDVPVNAVRRNADIEGQVSAVGLAGGEVITTAMFVGVTDLSGSKSAVLDKGNVAVTVQFDPVSATLVRPGDSINILARTCAIGTDCPLVSTNVNTSGSVVISKPATYVFQNVKVVAVDGDVAIPSAATGAGEVDPKAAAAAPTAAASASGRITVQLPPAQAALLASVRDADLYLTLNRPDYVPVPVPPQAGLPALPGQTGTSPDAKTTSGK